MCFCLLSNRGVNPQNARKKVNTRNNKIIFQSSLAPLYFRSLPAIAMLSLADLCFTKLSFDIFFGGDWNHLDYVVIFQFKILHVKIFAPTFSPPPPPKKNVSVSLNGGILSQKSYPKNAKVEIGNWAYNILKSSGVWIPKNLTFSILNRIQP